MNWFSRDRLLLIGAGIGALAAVGFWFSAKSDWDKATIRLEEATLELNRLERLDPYPSAENARKMKGYTDDYAAALDALKTELKTRVLPLAPLAPSEFQTRLRQAMASTAENARAHNVHLPEKFYLGFNEFASVLPSEAAAPRLGQELAQIEWLLGTLIEARVEALTSFRRVPSGVDPRSGGMSSGSPVPFEREVVDASFVSSPAAARKLLNQISQASQDFFVVRLLHIRNERDKGPPREIDTETGGAAAASPPVPLASPGERSSAPPALNFIVGNEHIETTARIEIWRFTL